MIRLRLIVISFLCLYGCNSTTNSKKMQQKSSKIVIAHRGASGYLPEHTLASKSMAFAMNPDYIEQDLVLSKDSVPIVIHDIHLETITDVAIKFPDRKRVDGHYYVIDFAFAELKQLQVTERLNPESGDAVYKDRFPKNKSSFQLNSLQEEIELIQGLNKSAGKNIGIYPEIKEPAFHLKEGKDISKIVLNILTDYGYEAKGDKCILQCFDIQELQRIRSELKSELFLVQLIETNATAEQLKAIASYADGVGPWYQQITPDFVKKAHTVDLKVHAYTFRADDLGAFKSFNALLDHGFNTLNLDGIFTDFPDKGMSFLRQQES